MRCAQCHARNSPAAFACHNCEAALNREEVPRATPGAASTWKARARSGGLAVAASLLLLGTVRGGDWIGDWLARNPPPSQPGSRAAMENRAMLEARYESWKLAHALPVEDLMALYAADARIFDTSGRRTTLQDLRRMAQEVRQNHTFDQVSDVGPLRISIEGARATVAARHRYGHSGRPQQPSFGDRTLIWEERDGVWLIVEDHFPSRFSNQPQEEQQVLATPQLTPR